MRSFSTTTAFDNQLKKLDSSIESKIIKRMQKVIEKIEKYGIIYTFNQEQVTFVFLDHREKVYGKI